MPKRSSLLSLPLIGAYAFAGSTEALCQSPADKAAAKAIVDSLHPPPKESVPPRGIVLLPGYKNLSASDFEGNKTGDIVSDKGLSIQYEGGASQGWLADPRERSRYKWFRAHVVRGHRVYVALAKDRELLVTFPWDGFPNDWPAMNFRARVRTDEDIADILLMVLGCEVCHSP